MSLAPGPRNRLRGTHLQLMCHDRNGCHTGASWNGNLLPWILKRPCSGPLFGLSASVRRQCVPSREGVSDFVNNIVSDDVEEVLAINKVA